MRQNRCSSSRLSQEDSEGRSHEKVPARRLRIPLACGPCRTSKSRCYGSVPTCNRCQSLDLECVPTVKLAWDVAEEKLQEIALESELEQLQNMMNELELEGWHVVSREEVEEFELSNSRSK